MKNKELGMKLDTLIDLMKEHNGQTVVVTSDLSKTKTDFKSELKSLNTKFWVILVIASIVGWGITQLIPLIMHVASQHPVTG